MRRRPARPKRRSGGSRGLARGRWSSSSRRLALLLVLLASSLLAVFGLQQRVQGMEPVAPLRSLVLDPCRSLVEGARLERQEVLAAAYRSAYQAGALEQPDVLGHRVERDRERLGDVGHPRLTAGEPLED